MQPFIQLDGLVAPMDRANVDTDLMVPKQFLKSIRRSGFGPNLFDELRVISMWVSLTRITVSVRSIRLPAQLCPISGCLDLAGKGNFGCGSSREHAAWAMEDYGFRAVIAPSFADIFRSNALKNGILPIALSASEVDLLFEATYAHEGYRLQIDLETCSITLPDGAIWSLRSMLFDAIA